MGWDCDDDDNARDICMQRRSCPVGSMHREANLSLMQVGFLCQAGPQGSRAPALACRKRLVPATEGKATAAWKCCRTKRSRLDSTPTPDTSDVDLHEHAWTGLA